MLVLYNQSSLRTLESCGLKLSKGRCISSNASITFLRMEGRYYLIEEGRV